MENRKAQGFKTRLGRLRTQRPIDTIPIRSLYRENLNFDMGEYSELFLYTYNIKKRNFLISQKT